VSLTKGERAALWLGVFGYGWAPGPGLVPGDSDKAAAKAIGALALAVEAWGWWRARTVTKNPDTMNAFFRTGGALSGLRSDTEAKILRGYE
jgi:hypothetical protein